MKVAIIGGGNIGSMFAESVSKSLARADEILLIEKDPARRAFLAERLPSAKVCASPAPEIMEAGLVLLSVKPQDSREACGELCPFVSREQLIISIMAGVRVDTLKSQLKGVKAIVRCMPNLPSKVGAGMTVFFADSSLQQSDIDLVRRLFDSVGRSLQVSDENLIDAATAISGSGPAYLLFVIENILKAARALGFSEEHAKLLALQTLKGTAAWLEEERETPEELRARITSKGGTTAAAIAVLEREKVADAFAEAIFAARNRAAEMSTTNR